MFFLRFSEIFLSLLLSNSTRQEAALVARERKLRWFSWTNALLIKRWWGGKRHEGGHEEETLCSRHALSLFVRSYSSLCAAGEATLANGCLPSNCLSLGNKCAVLSRCKSVTPYFSLSPLPPLVCRRIVRKIATTWEKAKSPRPCIYIYVFMIAKNPGWISNNRRSCRQKALYPEGVCERERERETA